MYNILYVKYSLHCYFLIELVFNQEVVQYDDHAEVLLREVTLRRMRFAGIITKGQIQYFVFYPIC